MTLALCERSRFQVGNERITITKGMFQRDDEWSVLFNSQHQALKRLFLFLLVRNHEVKKKGLPVTPRKLHAMVMEG